MLAIQYSRYPQPALNQIKQQHRSPIHVHQQIQETESIPQPLLHYLLMDRQSFTDTSQLHHCEIYICVMKQSTWMASFQLCSLW